MGLLRFSLGSGVLAIVAGVSMSVDAGPVDGMRCLDGTILTGDTGPERTITPDLFCRFFPKFPWQYPPLGYENKHPGASYPFSCDRQLGGYVYANPGMPTCPMVLPEEIHERCIYGDYVKEIIRDIACVVKRDPEKLGRFLNNKNEMRNKFELASFLAHLGQETADLRTTWENDGKAGQYCDYFYPGDDKYCTPNRLFFGRGVHQLTHPSNYADFSAYWFNDKHVLLENPEKVLDNMEISWGSAIWFWMDPRQHHNGNPECTKTTLMHEALFSGLGFGQTISAINGGIECSGSNRIGPWQRLGRLIYFLDVAGVSMPFFDGTLKTIPKWFTEGCSYIGTYKLNVSRSTWKELESNGGKCRGYNQPYLCGWGGLTVGPQSVQNPLIAFDNGGGPIPDHTTCVNWDKPQGGTDVWPHPLLSDGGYFPTGDMSSTSTSRPSSSTSTSTPSTSTTTTSRPSSSSTSTSTTGTGTTCSGCHISQLKDHQNWKCNPAAVAQYCSPPWDNDDDPTCCTRPDFETFANTQGCTCM